MKSIIHTYKASKEPQENFVLALPACVTKFSLKRHIIILNKPSAKSLFLYILYYIVVKRKKKYNKNPEG